jgi:hypothetical protein
MFNEECPATRGIVLQNCQAMGGFHRKNAQAAVPFKRAKFHLAVFRNLKFTQLRSQFFFQQRFSAKVLLFYAAVLNEFQGRRRQDWPDGRKL